MADIAETTSSENAVPALLRRDREGVATLTLNRPRQYNALSTEMMAALQKELDTIKENRGVKTVVIEGANHRFCAGHDLKELRANSDRTFFEGVFAQCSQLMLSLVRLPQPVIAKVEGIATAAGCQLVASCDLAYAAETAQFGTPGVNIGLFCSTPMVALSRAVPRKQAMEMLLSGEMISAKKAEAYGLINHAVPAAELDAEVTTMAQIIVSKSPLSLRIGKEAFYRQIKLGLEDAYSYASEVMTRNMLARDAEEGIDAFLEKRTPVWDKE